MKSKDKKPTLEDIIKEARVRPAHNLNVRNSDHVMDANKGLKQMALAMMAERAGIDTREELAQSEQVLARYIPEFYPMRPESPIVLEEIREKLRSSVNNLLGAERSL